MCKGQKELKRQSEISKVKQEIQVRVTEERTLDTRKPDRTQENLEENSKNIKLNPDPNTQFLKGVCFNAVSQG